jgi:hypothetical protein
LIFACVFWLLWGSVCLCFLFVGLIVAVVSVLIWGFLVLFFGLLHNDFLNLQIKIFFLWFVIFRRFHSFPSWLFLVELLWNLSSVSIVMKIMIGYIGLFDLFIIFYLSCLCLSNHFRHSAAFILTPVSAPRVYSQLHCCYRSNIFIYFPRLYPNIFLIISNKRLSFDPGVKHLLLFFTSVFGGEHVDSGRVAALTESNISQP